jgi:hypothetical protein
MTSPTVRLKGPQWKVFNSTARFRVLAAGRRFGKTFLSMIELCRAAWAPGRLAWYVAPSYKQAKRIIWKPLKDLTRPYWARTPNETDLRIELITGGTIALRGADNYDSLRGNGLDFVVLDEYASMAGETWTEVLRPALADRQGRALFIGTPHGFNHFYRLYESASRPPDWERFQFSTAEGENVPASEIEAATHELDERVFRQEFLASFENLTYGRAYPFFDRNRDVRDQGAFDIRYPIFWALDFNIGNMGSVIGQKIGDFVRVYDEILIRDKNTFDACDAFLVWANAKLSDMRKPIQLHVYGDATGEGRDSTSSRTDWQIVREFFKRHPDLFSVTFKVPTKNPEVKDRINCMNGRLKSQAGDHCLRVDPRCEKLIEDLERVQWKQDSDGAWLPSIDKSDIQLTHLSDALGYMVAKEFPMKAMAGLQPGSIL